jgi:nucleoside-diphosphate-sugar epimerase
MMTGAIRGAARVVLARHGEALMRINERGGWVAAALKGTKRWLNTTPSAPELEHLYSRKAIYDWSKAGRLLGYRPAVDLDRGLRLSVHWLKYAGVLN